MKKTLLILFVNFLGAYNVVADDICYETEEVAFDMKDGSKKKLICQSYLKWRIPLSGSKYTCSSDSENYLVYCDILNAIKYAKPAKKSFLGKEVFDSKSTLPIAVFERGLTTESIEKSIKESNEGKVTPAPVKEHISGNRSKINVIFRADLDNDGFEDAVVWYQYGDSNFSYTSDEIAIVSRTTENQDLLNYNSSSLVCKHHNSSYSCAEKNGSLYLWEN